MSPADIVAAPEFRAGLARRLAEVGLIPLEQPSHRLATVPEHPVAPTENEDRKAA